ncbi:hypothetical protein HPB51_013284 [Rhipicephalus microplus]|uniref:Uncharacterized protein n=1 Tax=Rhipicephalus microplus TaxID=6941 RepID=A0A9J6EGB1_RHIMP|nr:hypothetical protein HPB51_013284 [Rhipicephalus microplus]
MKKAPSRCSLHDKAPFFSLLSPPGARPAEGDEAHSSARLLFTRRGDKVASTTGVRWCSHAAASLRLVPAPRDVPSKDAGFRVVEHGIAEDAAKSASSSEEAQDGASVGPVRGQLPGRATGFATVQAAALLAGAATTSTTSSSPASNSETRPQVDLSDVCDTALVQARTPKSERKFACQRLPSNAAGVVT